MFEGLSNYFVQYEVPMGLLAKVLELRNYRINLLVDDSGSMMSTTDVTFREGTSYVRGANPPEKFMTRMQEAENRYCSATPCVTLALRFYTLSLPIMCSFPYSGCILCWISYRMYPPRELR